MTLQATPLWIETRWINSVGISDDGRRIVAATFYHDYDIKGPGPNKQGVYETYCYDANDQLLWSDAYGGWDGVFAVAISGDGKIAAAGGWYNDTRGLLRAYNARTGEKLLDSLDVAKRVSLLSLSDDGNVLAAAAERAYVYIRRGGSFLPAEPAFIDGFPGSVSAVAVHSSGNWLVCCDKRGNVKVAELAKGVVTRTHAWDVVMEPVDPADKSSPQAPVPFLSAAIAKHGDVFAVAGGNGIYVSSLKDIAAGKKPERYEFWDASAPAGTPATAEAPAAVAQNVRWVAVSGDGALITCVANRTSNTGGGTGGTIPERIRSSREAQFEKPDKDDKGTGAVIALNQKNGVLSRRWMILLENNPNSTSIDAPPKPSGADAYPPSKYVTVADGYPVGQPAKFYLFDAGTGETVWEYKTNDMNWPMSISADGSTIVGGSDNGGVYLFGPDGLKPSASDGTTS